MTPPNQTRIDDVRAALQRLREDYLRRDRAAIDQTMAALFDPQSSILIFGTGNHEGMVDFAGAKEIIDSDWEGWGTFDLNAAGAEVQVEGDAAWFAARGKVIFVRETDQVMERMINLVKYYLDQPLPPEEKLYLINWFVSQVICTPLRGKLQFDWPIRLTGTLTRQAGGRWVFRQMNFSHPLTVRFPDDRLETSGYAPVGLEKLRVQLHEWQDRHGEQDGEAKAIRQALTNLQKYVFNPVETSLQPWAGTLLADDLTLVGFEDRWAHGWQEASDLLHEYAGWGTLRLFEEDMTIAREGGAAWVSGVGTLRQTVSGEQLAQEQLDALRKLAEEDSAGRPAEARLMEMLRQTSAALKERTSGEAMTYPVRLMAALTKGEGGWVFRHIGLSFGTSWGPFGKLEGIKLE